MPTSDAEAIVTSTGDRRPAVIVLTLAEDHRLVSRALLAGSSGYLVKGASREEIVTTIRAVANGQIVVGSTIGR